jgi:predicted LPLAT superfamily acyltransferase
MAFVSGAPLFILFTFRVKKGKHQIILSAPRHVKTTARSERNAAIQASAQDYAGALERMVRQHPFQWYIFEPFFRTPAVGESARFKGQSVRTLGASGG